MSRMRRVGHFFPFDYGRNNYIVSWERKGRVILKRLISLTNKQFIRSLYT